MCMALSPLSIAEDDCNSDGLKINVFSIVHAQTLAGKYYWNDEINNWDILTFEKAKSFINNVITIRSPMTCLTSNNKLCQKCFGTKQLPTEYVGIVAAQVLAER